MKCYSNFQWQAACEQPKKFGCVFYKKFHENFKCLAVCLFVHNTDMTHKKLFKTAKVVQDTIILTYQLKEGQKGPKEFRQPKVEQ